MQKNIITAAVVVTALALVAIAYMSLVVVPQNKIDAVAEQARLDRIEANQQQALKEINYSQCKADAYEVYSMDWEQSCKTAERGEDCNLPAYRAEQLNDEKTRKESVCLTIYTAK